MLSAECGIMKKEFKPRSRVKDDEARGAPKNPAMTFRFASAADCPRLAEWNHQLIRDEGHRNPMTVAQLEVRMRGWLKAEYRAVIFEENGGWLAYILYREEAKEIYLRQLFVRRDRRRTGIGRKAVEIIREKIWPKDKRLTLEVLVANGPALAFWRAMGYADYSLMLEIMPKREKKKNTQRS